MHLGGGGVFSALGDIISSLRDIMICVGGYHQFIAGVPQ